MAALGEFICWMSSTGALDFDFVNPPWSTAFFGGRDGPAALGQPSVLAGWAVWMEGMRVFKGMDGRPSR